MAQRWTDEMLDRQADQIAETRAQLAEMRSQLVETRAQQAEDRTRLAETRDRIDALIEAQQMLVQIYQQEHEARVEADRRFNRFIEEQQQINQEQKQINARLAALLSETRDRIDALIEAQQMLVQIYQQEHEARVEADRRFNRFIEEQQQINQEQKQINARLAALLEELQQMIRFSRDNGNPN